MTLSDLDHAISTLESSATADAVSETLEFLRGLRERASETTYIRCLGCGATGWGSVICGCDILTQRTEPVPALLILTPEDS